MRRTCYAAVVFTMLVATGCAHYGALEDEDGVSYNAAKSGQILDPGASKNLEPVMGMSGKAAEAAMKQYTDSFNKKECGKPDQQGFMLMPATTGTDIYGKQEK